MPTSGSASILGLEGVGLLDADQGEGARFALSKNLQGSLIHDSQQEGSKRVRIEARTPRSLGNETPT